MTDKEYKPWDGSAPPDGLEAAFGDRSLSNPSVVGELVSGFCHDVSSLAEQTASGDMDGKELDDAIKARCVRLSGLFTGDNPEWQVTTWHTASLGGLRSRATALLASAKVNYGDESNFDPSKPVAGLLYLLAKQCLSAYKASVTDPDGEKVHPIVETMQLVIGTLIGTPTKADE